jgi:hypothetical protein
MRITGFCLKRSYSCLLSIRDDRASSAFAKRKGSLKMRKKKASQSLTERESHVEEQLRSAIRTLKRMPPVRVQGYYSAWPEVVRDEMEILNMAKEPLRVRPTARDIQELEQVLFDWIPSVSIDERRLLWSRAARVPWKMVCAELGVGRTKAWEMYKRTLGKIVKNL